MTWQEFFTKYNGKYVDIDGKYGNQCKDLFSAYNTEVAENPNYVWGDAWKLFDNAPVEYYYKYLKGMTPLKAGDVVIWGKNYGGYGHVAICTEANDTGFKAFGQNYPKITKLDANGKVLANGSPPNISTFSYNMVVGWLRPKKTATIPDMATLHDFKVDGMPADERIEALKTQVRTLQGEVKKRDDMINSPTDGIKVLKETVVDRDKLLDGKRTRINELERELEACQNKPQPDAPTVDRVAIAREEITSRLTGKINAIVEWLFS